MIFAFIILLSISVFKAPKNLRIFKHPPLLLLFGSLGLAFNYLGFMKGIALSGASNAQIMIQIGPITLMLMGFLIYKEGVKPFQLFWIAVSFMGFFLFFKDQAAFIQASNLLAANTWLICAAFAWAIYGLVMKKKSSQGYSVNELNLLVFCVCSFLLSLNLNLAEISKFSLYQWSFLFLLGINTAIIYSCLGAALKLAPASQVSIIITLNPIITLTIITLAQGKLSFIPHEPISLLGYLGAGLVIIGIIFSTLSSTKNLN